jgi:ribosomal protein S18 acetylase RimI-like enzyme
MRSPERKKSPPRDVERVPVLSVDVHHEGKEVKAILKRHGAEIVERTRECFNLELPYYSTVGDLALLRVDGALAGIAAMGEAGDGRWYLSTVCTFREFRGRGYCTPFIRALLERDEYRRVVTYLEVDRANAAAVRCYVKAGFVLHSRYDETYDVYEYRTPLNLLVYCMASNHPGLAEETGAVSLELGVMGDVGKLLMGAYDVASERWTVRVYLDVHPGDYVLSITRTGGVVSTSRTPVRDRKDRARDRLATFLREYYRPLEDNGLVVGGHGMTYPPPRPAEFWPVAYRRDGSVDTLTLPEIRDSIPATLRFLVLDSCCLSTLEAAGTLEGSAEYLIAYQGEGPWNGFISRDTLSLYTTRPTLLSFLQGSAERYLLEAESQEQPSPITLIRTAGIGELLALSDDLPPTTDPEYRDLLTYANDRLRRKVQKARFKRAFDRVVVGYVVPSTYSARAEEHGLSFYA